MHGVMSATEIAELDRLLPDHMGCKCATCGRVWRVWYDTADECKVRAKLPCACEGQGAATGAAWH